LARRPKEIVFTSGATESTTWRSRAWPRCTAEKGNHIITEATEHKAVLDTCKRLEKYGYACDLPAGGKADGLIDLDRTEGGPSRGAKTILISIMYANNEIGVMQPIAEIGKICQGERACYLPHGRSAGDQARFRWMCRRRQHRL
jgi:cysteine desulfurase